MCAANVSACAKSMTHSRLIGLITVLLLVASGSSAASGPAVSRLDTDSAAGSVGVIAADVEQAMIAAAPGENVQVIVGLNEQANLSARDLPRAARLHAAITALQATANRTQGRLLGFLRSRQAQGLVAEFSSLWVFNALTVTAHPRSSPNSRSSPRSRP